jgi:hypothetical protein
MRELLVVAEVLSNRVAVGRYDVPAHATVRIVIERRDLARQQPRRIKGCRQGRRDADFLGRHQQIWRQNGRIEFRSIGRCLEIVVHAVLIGVGNPAGIFEDDEVKTGALQRPYAVLKNVRLGPIVARSVARRVPALDRDAWSEKPSQVELNHLMLLLRPAIERSMQTS